MCVREHVRVRVCRMVVSGVWVSGVRVCRSTLTPKGEGTYSCWGRSSRLRLQRYVRE